MANSKEELLKWLALKPRTQGWGAVAAYNRNKCNSLILQDYINKFTTGSYLPPINKPVPTGNANWEHLSDWVQDAPRLYFDEAYKTAGGEINLRMAIVGGTQVSIDDVTGPKRAIAVKSIDALDYPELSCRSVALSKTSGTVGKDTGEVVLDLGDPETAKGEWELSFANTQHERDKGGQFFKKYFREADKEKRLYHLGKVAYTAQQYLKPASFRLRTITAAGAESSSAPNFADGAVELFIRMEGDEEGGTPPTDDWRMLIPDDADASYDCTVLFNNKIVMQKGIYPGALLPGETTKFRLEEITEGGLITGYKVRDFTDEVLKFSLERITVGNQFVDPYHGVWMQLGWGGYKVSLVRQGSHFGHVSVSWSDDDQVTPLHINHEVDKYSDVRYSRSLLAYYQYQIEPATGVATFVLLDSSVKADFKDVNLSRWFNAAEIALILDNLSAQVVAHLKKVLQHIADSAKSLDVFVANSILFSDNNTVRLHDGSMPGDLAFFGTFTNPFTVEPLELLMGHSANHTFKLSKEFTGKAEWSVTAIPGSSGGIGEIDKESGLYTAPIAGEIKGTFTRVKITATDPISKYSSSSLVTIVVRDITVNPVIESCNASAGSSKSERKFSANTLGTGTLEWKVSRGNGSIPLRGTDGENTYTAALKDDNINGAFEVDEIEVKNLATGKIQTSYVVVNHFPSELTVTLDMSQSSLPDGKAKFKALRRATEEKDAIWEVAAGSGHIDSQGFYTADPAGQHRFALITARTEIDGVIDRNGWCITPLPLIELPDKPPDDFMAD